MENKLFDSPKPAKAKTSVKDRVFKNPYTSILGLILIGAGLYVLQMDLTDMVKLSSSALLFGGALVAFGLKDKKDKA